MHEIMHEWMHAAASSVVLASSGDSEGGEFYLLLLGPLAGIGFYTMTYLRYRNTDKRYNYEHETASEIEGMQAYDQKVGEVRGTERRRIDGDNSTVAIRRLGQNTIIHHDY